MKRNWTAEEDAKLVSLRNGGQTYATIAAALNVSRSAACGRFRRLTSPPQKPRVKVLKGRERADAYEPRLGGPPWSWPQRIRDYHNINP